jgi:hypothetical protein
MSIFHFSRKNSKKKKHKKDSIEQSFNMEKHLKEFAKEVNNNATYKSEQNAVYRSFRSKMERAKKK